MAGGDLPKPSVKFDRLVFRDIIADIGSTAMWTPLNFAKLCQMEEVSLQSRARLYEKAC